MLLLEYGMKQILASAVSISRKPEDIVTSRVDEKLTCSDAEHDELSPVDLGEHRVGIELPLAPLGRPEASRRDWLHHGALGFAHVPPRVKAAGLDEEVPAIGEVEDAR